jgi:hypothetical protein
MFAVAALTLVGASCGGQQFPQSERRPAKAPDPAAARALQARLLSSVHRTSTLRTARVALSMKLLGTTAETMSVTGSGCDRLRPQRGITHGPGHRQR